MTALELAAKNGNDKIAKSLILNPFAGLELEMICRRLAALLHPRTAMSMCRIYYLDTAGTLADTPGCADDLSFSEMIERRITERRIEGPGT